MTMPIYMKEVHCNLQMRGIGIIGGFCRFIEHDNDICKACSEYYTADKYNDFILSTKDIKFFSVPLGMGEGK